jgi:hypothetical protein
MENKKGSASGLLLKYHPSISMEGLRTTTKIHNLQVGRESNKKLSEYCSSGKLR